MGLDLVELMMEIETAFGADLNDPAADDIRTAGQMHAFLARQLDVTDDAGRARLWTRLVDVIERVQGVPRDRIVPDARLLEDLDIH
jgi:hypothetical protein